MYRNEQNIAVLMATYNGERFLSEQMESLFKQGCRDFHLYIRDDGSKDNTLAVIHSFMEKYPECITIVEDSQPHRGAAGSFMYMLQQVESRYYMFCDQDDVWLDYKIESSLSFMQEVEAKATQHGTLDTPVVIATDLCVVDENLKVLRESFNSNLKIDVFRKHPEMIYVRHVVTGCTMMLNQAAKNVSIPMSDLASMHDEWVALCTYSNKGVVAILDDPTICYRQHSSNTLGANMALRKWFCRFFNSFGRKQFCRMAKLVHRDFGISYLKFLQYKIMYSWL